MYNNGKIPAVFKIIIATNQPNWLFLAAFHSAIAFKIPSKMTSKIMKGKIIKKKGLLYCCPYIY